ncbi:MAG: sugar ABC transporter permease, partial [Bifidobacteriaceae bacterium]|nr:sugar ABC transporter permease [Bifidobacteriaceae bacterium]
MRTKTIGHPGRRLVPQGMPWLLPALVLSVGLIYYCVGYVCYISTLDWDGVSSKRDFIGLANYVKLFRDPVFWDILQHVLIFFVVGFAAEWILGLSIAVMLHSKVRFAGLYRVIVFLPALLAYAVMAPVQRHIFALDGTLNSALKAIGLDSLTRPWLADGSTTLWVVILVQTWHSVGLAFILFYAAISQIDPEILEAARLDGAGNLRVVTAVIVPGVRSTSVALAILFAINSLKTFEIPWLVTMAGPNHASEFLGTYIYQYAVQRNKMGYAGAVSV